MDALIQTGHPEEGLKSVVVEKSRHLLCMMDFMSVKQTLGEAIVCAHESFIPLHQTAIRARDAVVREECTRDQGILNIKRAITLMQVLFDTCKTFLTTKPSQEAFEGCIMTYGINPFSEDLDEASLQTILEKPSKQDPRIMR